MRPVGVTAYAFACGISRNGVYKAIERGDVHQRDDGKIDLDNSTNKTYLEHCQANAADKAPARKKASTSKKKKKTATLKKKSTVKAKGVDTSKAAGKGKPGGGKKNKPDAEKAVKEDISDAEIETTGEGAQGALNYGDSMDLDTIAPELREILKHGIGDNKKINLDALKVFEEIKSKIQDRNHKRGLLVERDLIREIFGKLWVVDTTELKTLGIRLSPGVASLVQDKVEAIRNEEPAYKDSPILTRVNEFVNSTDFMREINELATGEVMKTLEHIKRIIDEFLISKGAEPMGELDEAEMDEPEPAEVPG